MTKSKVYFTNLRTRYGHNRLQKLRQLLAAAGLGEMTFEGKYTAIKMHLGEPGNLGYLRPNYAKVVADFVKENKGKVFLTDCNTLYPGRRKNALDHLEAAYENGFSPFSVGCHIIIGDGLRGTDDGEVEVKGGVYVKKAKIGQAILAADNIISLSHFKGHDVAGFGGAMKNLGMGCGSVRGKMDMHSEGKPKINPDKCRGCGFCIKDCGQDAIVMTEGKAHIEQALCAGCGRCIGACPFSAVRAAWDVSNIRMNQKVAEYAKAVVQDRGAFHINLMIDIAPGCDCMSFNDLSILPDVGFFASYDPVALDMACVDMARTLPALPNSYLTDRLEEMNAEAGEKDPFHICHPDSDWLSGLLHGEAIGLGSREYELITV